MNIVVCIKQVPDTETRIKLTPDGKSVDFTGVKWVINPYDEFALEEAIKIKEKLGGQVTVVCIGPQRAEEAIRTGLAMGADTAIHVKEDVNDPISSAKVLAAVISKLQYDLILCGKQAIDDDMAATCSALGEFLDIPNVNIAIKIDLSADGKTATVVRQIEGAEEIVYTQLPAVVSCQKGLNTPRYPTLPNIMKAKKKPIKTMTVDETGIKKEELDNLSVPIGYSLPQARSAGIVIEGENAEELAVKLVKMLHEEAKVI